VSLCGERGKRKRVGVEGMMVLDVILEVCLRGLVEGLLSLVLMQR